VVVSHDRYLLERVTDTQMALLGDGRLRDLPGGVDQYLELRRAAPSLRVTGSSASPAVSRDSGAGNGSSEADLRQARKDLARIERQITKLDAQKGKLHQQMDEAGAKPDADFEYLAGLNAKLRTLQEETQGLEEQWVLAAEVLGE
jgi:ATPase subunit of ABC transporter with duplicated ATPase domains